MTIIHGLAVGLAFRRDRLLNRTLSFAIAVTLAFALTGVSVCMAMTAVRMPAIAMEMTVGPEHCDHPADHAGPQATCALACPAIQASPPLRVSVPTKNPVTTTLLAASVAFPRGTSLQPDAPPPRGAASCCMNPYSI